MITPKRSCVTDDSNSCKSYKRNLLSVLIINYCLFYLYLPFHSTYLTTWHLDSNKINLKYFVDIL